MHRSVRLFILVVIALAAPLGCAADLALDPATGVDGKADGALGALVTGTPASVGVLALLNDPSTTFALLDDAVALDRRAAASLIAHRDGPDGAFGTADDDLYDTIEEVDAQYYVGESALTRLAEHAALLGFTPEGDDHLWTVEGVAFTVAEAERSLRIVNEESDGVLRVEVGLDSRSVSGIIAARPIRSVVALGAAYWVGPASLTRIRDYAAPPAPTGAVCRFHGACPEGQRCVGIPNDESSDTGRCRDLTALPGEGDDCEAESDCGSGLTCTGLTLGYGICNPSWMRDTFVSTTIRHIPETSVRPITTSVVVTGQATVPMDIVVSAQIAHSDPEALRLMLVDPNGDEALLHDGASGEPMPERMSAGWGISRDSAINGRWLLRIYTDGEEGLGTLHGWTLDITSRWD
jgi:subtilisin-like proprotein convertase family protein